MAKKPSYEKLEQRVEKLEKEASERKNVEEQLRILSLVFEQDSNSITILDREGKVEYANPKALDTYKMSLDDVIGKHWESFLSMESTLRKYLQEIMSTVLEKKEMWTGEISDADVQGKTIWRQARLFPIKDENGGIISIVYMSQDITERKRAEEVFRISEEKFGKLFKANPIWTAITTLEEGRYIEVNEAFTQITGYEREEVIGLTSTEIGLWLDPEERTKPVKRAKERGGFRDQEVSFRRKNGDQMTALWSAEVTELNGEICLISGLVFRFIKIFTFRQGQNQTFSTDELQGQS